MHIILNPTPLPYFERVENKTIFNFCQRKVKVTDRDEEGKEVETEKYEIYHEEVEGRIPTIRERKLIIKEGVQMYADTQKSFTLNGTVGWIDSERRASIARAVAAHSEDKYTLWLGGKPFDLEKEQVIRLLDEVEAYSSECYNVTARFIQQIDECGADLESIYKMDFTKGYPEKLTFEL